MRIEVFEVGRSDVSKRNMKVLQREYMRHDPSWRYNCMCSHTFRKVAHKHFYEWYDAQRD